MPRYEYRCPRCELQFQEIRPAGSREPVLCPECGRAADKQEGVFRIGGMGPSCEPPVGD